MTNIKTMKFTHSTLASLTLKLKRKRKQEGGRICLFYGLNYEATIETISASLRYSGEVMSRQQVGDKILKHIREGWCKSNNANQEG